MKSIVIIFIFLLFAKYQFAQDIYPQFYDYDTIISELRSTGKLSDNYPSLNYKDLLKLDKSCYPYLLKLYPEIANIPYLDTNYFPIKETFTGFRKFDVKINDIKEYFTIDSIFKYINDSIEILEKNYQPSYEKTEGILIKGKEKAIYVLIKDDQVNTYYAILLKNVLYIDLLDSYEEFRSPVELKDDSLDK